MIQFTAKDVERFRSYINILPGENSCHIWVGSKNKQGYGNFRVGGKFVSSHRFSWTVSRGPIPENMCVCHDCPSGDNPSCVNAFHMFLGSVGDNNRDKAKKGGCRPPTGEKHGLNLHPERRAYGERNGSKKFPEKLMRGADHHNVKLTEEKVIAIRKMYSQGGMSYKKMAPLFDITPCHVRDVVKRRVWKQVP